MLTLIIRKVFVKHCLSIARMSYLSRVIANSTKDLKATSLTSQINAHPWFLGKQNLIFPCLFTDFPKCRKTLPTTYFLPIRGAFNWYNCAAPTVLDLHRIERVDPKFLITMINIWHQTSCWATRASLLHGGNHPATARTPGGNLRCASQCRRRSLGWLLLFRTCVMETKPTNLRSAISVIRGIRCGWRCCRHSNLLRFIHFFLVCIVRISIVDVRELAGWWSSRRPCNAASGLPSSPVAEGEEGGNNLYHVL